MGNKASQQGNQGARQGQGQGQGQGQAGTASPENVQVNVTGESSPTLRVPFPATLGGGNGWPSEVTVVLYHQAMGVLVVGTESGTVYAHGDGFQYMQANLSGLDITNIVEFSNDKIIVTFAENSLAVLSLPSLTLLARLDNWLGKSCGDISAIYSNYCLCQNYVFVGTSDGYVRVLEITSDDNGKIKFVRECDYAITNSNAGVPAKMVVSSLQLCPKEQKYLAISYDGPSASKSTGITVIYDLSKKKVHRSYKSVGVTSLAWNHLGDVLYAGTRSGEVLALGLEKSSCLNVWNVKSEIINGDGDDIEDKATSVRKMIWMGPQKPNDVGCLFVLIGSFGSDTENLKSVIVALTPSTLHSSTEMEQVLSVPPILGIEVVGFRLVSTLDHSTDTDTEVGVPGLLMLGQSESSNGEGTVRELLLLQCPASLVTEWSMELGLLPEPRPAMEVLPGKSPISCIKGIVPDPSTDSMSFKLLQMLQDDDADVDATTSRFVRMRAKTTTAEASLSEEIMKVAPVEDKRGSASRRRSTRDFFSDINTAIFQMETMVENSSSWALTLATAVEDSSIYMDMDIVFVGHEDGSIVVWATSLPPEITSTSGSGNVWIPVTAIKCGTQKVCCIDVSEKNNVVAVGDVAGNVSLWQIPNSSSSGFKRLFSTVVDSQVSSLTLSNDGKVLVAGTMDGSLYELKDWSKSDMVKIQSLDHIGASGAVMKVLIAPYWKGTSYTYAIYVIYKSGHYGVVDHCTHQLLSFCSSGSNPIDLSEGGISDDDSCDEENNVDSDMLVYACVMRGNFEIVNEIPGPEEVKNDDSDDEVGNTPTKDVAQPRTTPPPDARKSFGFFKKGATPPPSTSSPQHPSISSAFPSAAPRYFVFLRGRYLVTCDLQKFALPAASERSSSLVFSSVQPHAVTMKFIGEGAGDGSFVAAQDVSVIEDSTRFWSQPIPCLSTIDSAGNMKMLSVPSGEVMSDSPVLPKVFSDEFNINSSTILPNGDVYLSTSNYMIYSSTPENKAYPQTNPVPCRASSDCSVPPSNQLLHMTIGDKDAASHMKTQTEKKDKRRSSVMSFAKSGPVDFQKLFSKSLDARRREELFGVSVNFDEEDEDEEDVVSSAQVKSTNSKAANTKAVLDETRQAFEERGERLGRLHKKMEDFGENAKLYKKNSAAHRERMRKKNERWGLF